MESDFIIIKLLYSYKLYVILKKEFFSGGKQKMALSVQYNEIRTDVIGRLDDLKGEMESNLQKLDASVQNLRSVMEGDALDAYMDEYTTIVKTIYNKLNVNLGEYSKQLESVCKEFEDLDADMHSQLSSGQEG